jgi:VWFA-related protein
VDFTANVALIQQALENLHPHLDPTFSSVPAYLAYLVVEQNDQTALSLLICRPNESPDNCSTTSVQALAQANLSLDFANSLSLSVLRGLDIIIRQMSTLPGQRTLVILSAGFQTWSTTFLSQIDQIVDNAIRAHVVINSLDARGLYGDLSVTDLNDSGPRTQDRLLMDLITVNPLLRDGETRLPDAMRAFAHDTGGIIIENSNDFNAGIRQTTGVPEVLYLLAFSPQNLRHDGAFHGLKVSLASSRGLSLQARHGYFAPRKSEDLAAQEKEEMRDAVFSLDEAHTLPLDVHTQFFMASQTDARVTVLTHIDLHTLRFRKDGGRNFDKLTLVTVLFDLDGNEVDAQKKIFEFQTHDAVLEKYLHSGITLDGRFKVKPGKYRVRTVLQESESGQMASLNRTFEIPY